jgi:hypothetical protein
VISAKRVLLTLALIALPALCVPAASSAAPPGPAWRIATTLSPTTLSPGDESGSAYLIVTATNVGSQATFGNSPITLTAELPQGLSIDPTPSGVLPFQLLDDAETDYPCSLATASCTANASLFPGEALIMRIPVDVAPNVPPVLTSTLSVSGGGASGDSETVHQTASALPVPFGLETVEGELLDAGGEAQTRAGTHPYQFRGGAEVNTKLEEFNGRPRTLPSENPKDIVTDLPPGLVINPEATAVRCTEVQLTNTQCPDAAAVGVARITLTLFGIATSSPLSTSAVYNMVPPQGRPAELGFDGAGQGIFIHLLPRIRSESDYGLSSETLDIPQFANMSGVKVDLWGDPTDPSHDHRRGYCALEGTLDKACPTTPTRVALLTMPSACSGPLQTVFTADSWQQRGKFLPGVAKNIDAADNPVGVTHCQSLAYTPKTETHLSTAQGETGTGFDFNLDFPNDGLIDPSATAESTTEKAVVTLPEGVTINPSVAEGLGVCTPAQYAKEGTFTVDGEGCPTDSKLGTLHVDTPLLKEGIDGSVYLAQQDDPRTTTPGTENPFDTDVALYLVLRNSVRGILVKKPMKVIPDPKTGQLVATLEDIPQLPLSHFSFHFKEGERSALITPAACGKYTTVAKFYPWSDPSNPTTASASFEITKGVEGSPCPPGGLPPFKPFFEAGSLNNNAKTYSPFNMRLLRKDGEQDMTKFSAILPPGVLGKLAGVSKCSDAAINSAKSKTGREEKASPSCPANSLIGHTYAGAGVGGALTYVPGQLYLGGPYHGDPLSVISITPALAGPFDAGTVVVREALTLNPETAEVIVDGKGSDPIPHILKGIVLKIRDLRVYVDRSDFIVNPTSCDPTTAKSTIFGAYVNVFDPADDVPVDLSTRYQAASCASLAFKPKLALNLNGGTKRGDHPALKAVLNARPGDANIGKAVVTLPQSAFLDQAHIRTICTRVQFAANGGAGGGCPKAAQYGYARAFTPLLDEPVEGPVYLRSSNHKLPDLVAALHGIVNVDIVGRIDSYKGGIRSSFETVPDAPVSKFILNMQGGKKGLVVNSRNLCAETNRGDAKFTGQNGVPYDFKPVIKPSCGGKRKGAKHGK